MCKDVVSKTVIQLTKEDRFEDAREYWEAQTPEYIYKFFALGKPYDDALIENLSPGRLYFNAPSVFNDTQEFTNIGFEIFDKNDLGISKQMRRKQISGNYVCCFCGEKGAKSAYMKNKYANNGNGFLCKFKVLNKGNILKVIYYDGDLHLDRLADPMNPDEKQLQKNHFLFDDLNPRLKTTKWQKEDEYRLTLDFEENFFLNKPDHYVDVRKILSLEGIRIFAHCSQNNKEKLKSVCGNFI